MSESGDVTYQGYLQLSTILDAQHPLAPPELGAQVQAAEHFFIVVHQAFELWFKQELLDLHCAVEALAPEHDDPELALDHLQRVAAIQRLLGQQMVLFDHLSPRSFLAFRSYLGQASGSESKQYRDVERALGLRGSAGSPIYRAFTAARERAGLSLEGVYQSPSRSGVLYRLAELLVDISEGFWLLTAAHVRIAERTIGQKPGTGGTSGVEYLAQALNQKAFPELWDVRTRL
ncbi:MAG: tryptophan 2,3-dioxygenase family protein [Chloroflexota bacterium]